MNVYIYEPDFSNRKLLDNIISAQFEFKYNGIGKFTVVLPEEDYNIALAKLNSIVYVKDYRFAYTVCEVEIDCDSRRITLNGYSANWLLNRRAVYEGRSVVNVESDVYSAVTANLRGLGISCAAAKGLSAVIDPTGIYGDELLDGVQKVLHLAGYGNRMNFDPATNALEWEIYDGEDKTAGIHSVAFVQERGNAPGLIIDKDQSTYKNVCYCEYSYGDEEATHILSVGTTTGGERREMFAVFSGDAQGETESNAAFEIRVKQYAALQLANNRDRIGFDVGGDPSQYGTKYKLGDLVWCMSLKYQTKFTARITGVTLVQDTNGSRMSLVIGDPILTVMG